MPWLGYGLLISTGAAWRSKRKLLTPAFHFKVLQDYVPISVEQTRVLIDVMYGFWFSFHLLLRLDLLLC